MKKAIYAGSFDPFHSGHESIVNKSLKIVDKLLLVVANNPEKHNSNIDDRKKILEDKYKNNGKVEVRKLNPGLLIAEYAKENGVNILVRSSRDVKDFEFELMMAIQNKKINHDIETILIMPDKANITIRSSLMPKKTD